MNTDLETPQVARFSLREKAGHRLRYKRGMRRVSAVVGARDWQDAVMALTGSDWGGNWNPPFAKTLRYKWQDSERVFSNDNDGMELWFGYVDKWGWHIGNNEMKALTKWLIWDLWIKSRWLGLRRPIYYFALRSKVDGYRRNARAS